MYQVIIVDDEPRILEGIIHLFPWNNFGFEVVASFTNGKEALEYINKYFERRESDILYKIIDKDVYILVEQQSKVDYRMPRRIFEYCMEIMLTIEGKDNNFLYKNPIILPIVIYTGENNWNVNTNFSDTQENYKEFQNYKINLNYKFNKIGRN